MWQLISVSSEEEEGADEEEVTLDIDRNQYQPSQCQASSEMEESSESSESSESPVESPDI